MINVLHILAPAREGGLERVVSMLSAGQREKGVHVVAVIEPGEAAEHPFITRMKALGIPSSAIEVGSRSYRKEYHLLGDLITRFKPAVVNTHGYRCDVIGATAARRNGVAVVSTVHGFTGGGIRNRFYEVIQCYALRRADAVIAVSAPLVERLKSAGIEGENIYVIPNGFAPQSALLDRIAAREELGISGEDFVVGWVSRMSREKGPDVMLEAIAATDDSIRLSMIGTGPELHRLTDQARRLRVMPRVKWHGSIANAGRLLRAFDAVVLSSRTEGTPIILLEAMHASVPIIATRVGGTPDVVSSDDAILVPAEDPQAIAEAISEVRRDPAGARSRTAHAQQRLISRFGAEQWLTAVDSAYRGAVDRASRRRRH